MITRKMNVKNLMRCVISRFGKRIVSLDHSGKELVYGVGFLKRSLKKKEYTIIDVGAADGTPALLQHYRPEEHRYVLIEANSRFYPYLDGFKERYHETVVEKCFCGEKDGSVPFYLNVSGRSSRYEKTARSETVDLPMKKLDSIMSHFDKGEYILKIDVEGAEMDVLHGSIGTLPCTDVVIVETWINKKDLDAERSFAHLMSFMTDQGFSFFDFFGGAVYANGVLKQVDAVFVRPESLREDAY